jgi:DNA-directed RNA polymerase beta' subunit
MDDMNLEFVLDDETSILSKAVVKINLASTTDHGKPKAYGLMDARMGSTDRAMLCQTCHQPHCAGHYGMIELPFRVYLVGHLKRLVFLLRCACGACCKPLFTQEECRVWNTEDLKRTERLKFISEKKSKIEFTSIDLLKNLMNFTNNVMKMNKNGYRGYKY